MKIEAMYLVTSTFMEAINYLDLSLWRQKNMIVVH